MSAPRFLLLLACSQRKLKSPGLLPAIDRYDGVNYRVLRKAMREGKDNSNFKVLILSAKYGLIDHDTGIEYYDLRMTRQRAMELQTVTTSKLREVLARGDYENALLNLGQIYLEAIDFETNPFGRTSFEIATGGIGKKMSLMKQWLNQLP